jgi:hypothetical protein
MPRLPSTVVIRYDGTDITNDVMPAAARFETLMNAAPGSMSMTVRDKLQVYDFVTGKEITCEIDGVLMWCGFLTRVQRKFAFPAVDTTAPGQVKSRLWVLTGVDLNILFDKRILRNPLDYLHQLPGFTSEDVDGALIREMLTAEKYFDLDDGEFDLSSQIDDTDATRTYFTRTNGSISSGALTVTVDDVDVIPPFFPFHAVIKDDPVTGGNREIVKVTGLTGLVLNIVRASQPDWYLGTPTSAVAHGDNSWFQHFAPGAWKEQGSTLRAQIEDLAQFSGAVYYFAADKTLHYHALEDEEARWGFSDRPNRNAITASPTSYQGATYGPRELDAVNDGEILVNDALIWGGSEWAGTDGQTVFARRENAPSEAEHGRWQTAEIHFGEEGFKTQRGVDARAVVIVEGGATLTGASAGFNPGLAYNQWNVTLGWFAHDVPMISGQRDHLIAGQLVHIELQVFEVDGFPLEQILPLRSMAISFPATKGNAESWVKFDGTFGLQIGDPFTLWRYLLGVTKRGGANAIVSAVDADKPAPYGSILSVEPIPATDSTTTVFYLPDGRGYIAGTSEMYVSPGNRLRRGIDYFESNPVGGQFIFPSAPDGSDWLWVVCRVL